jgi:5'-3' exonuclease
VKVHLVDGTYELFRAFYAVPAARDAEGRPVNALRGIAATLVSLVHEPGVSHVAVAFDHVIESFRNELYAGYKTGDGVDPDLLAQFHPAESLTDALGVVVWSMVDFEADDALATGAFRFRDAPGVEQVVICTPDKDLSQCVVGQRVICRDRRRALDRDAAGVVARFGVPPESIPDWLALVGDSADGFPGIPGWGEKTAAAVLSRHLHLEAVPDDPARWGVDVRGKERLAAALRERREEALLYRRLATLRTDVPLAEPLADLEWRGARRSVFEPLCHTIGAAELVDRVRRWRAE